MALEEMQVDARPTKEFFITVLIRDLLQIDAITDLVDNCVDGALRLKRNDNYNGLSIRLEVDKNHFKIADNCGGIPVDLAKNYAFRFGRLPGMEKTPHSVGQFGVGMKRAFFKLGKKIKVESKTKNEHFTIDIDVDKWKDEVDWNFAFSELKQNIKVPEEDCGTIITITSLNEDVQELFELENFINKLKNMIETKHHQNINQGLSITLNQVPLQVRLTQLLKSDLIKPAYKEFIYPPDHVPVLVKLTAGIADSVPKEGGWYVYCNGRLVIGPDQTLKTGWGEDDDISIPKYHNQFARFRGYAFFDCDEASFLPWNTTKTDIDTDSKIYRATRLEMVKLMRPVIDFLNRLDSEKNEVEIEGKPLEQAVNEAKATDISNVQIQMEFTAPEKPVTVKINKTSISFSRPTKEVDAVKKVLGVTSNKEVGEKTFEYFFSMECEK